MAEVAVDDRGLACAAMIERDYQGTRQHDPAHDDLVDAVVPLCSSRFLRSGRRAVVRTDCSNFARIR
jgi:hypothetical protein